MPSEKQLNIVNVPIADLKPSTYNPRKWDQYTIEQIKESIHKFGVVDPLIVNGAENLSWYTLSMKKHSVEDLLEWRCKSCRKILFQYSDTTSGVFIRKCQNSRCSAMNFVLFYEGEGHEVDKRLSKKKKFLNEALKDLPQEIVDDIMNKIN